MKHRNSSEVEALRTYEQLVRKYHNTLDLMSDQALEDFGRLAEQARIYADTIAALAPSARILDIGSGVGLPGIVIAIALPHQAVLLVERRRRRATFLKITVAQLRLTNAVVTESDVRDLAPDALDALDAPDALRAAEDREISSRDRFGVVTAQAVGSFLDTYRLTSHLHAKSVLLVSRKGPDWREEVAGLARETGAVPAVRAHVGLPHGGTLVAIEVRGGVACPPSA